MNDRDWTRGVSELATRRGRAVDRTRLRLGPAIAVTAIALACGGGGGGSDGDGGDLPPAETPKTALTFTRSVEGIRQLMGTVVSQGKTIAGQQCGDGNDTAAKYQAGIEALEPVTGRTVALMGADYGWVPDTDLPGVNAQLAKFWDRGGLVTVSWHIPNPFQENAGPRWDSVAHAASIDLASLLPSGSGRAHDLYRAQVDRVAAGLKELHDRGVVVLFRPFHEMNGSAFWWGSAGSHPAAFRALWRDLHDTLTNDQGLDNLIWVFAPGDTAGSGDYEGIVPEAGYVDMLGTDYYGISPRFEDASKLRRLGGGKPIAMTEIGPFEQSYGTLDERQVADVALSGQAAYFLQWHSWPGARVAIVDNAFANDMMDRQDVVTLDALDGRDP